MLYFVAFYMLITSKLDQIFESFLILEKSYKKFDQAKLVTLELKQTS